MEENKFEEPIQALEKRIESLSGTGADDAIDAERQRLIEQLEALRERVFGSLTPWQKTLVARHPKRPYTLDYAQHMLDSFQEIHGDRKFSDDPAIVCGFGHFRGRPVMLIGHEKGRDTKEKIVRNFGMPRPEGYRKALRCMQLANKFNRPIICLVDTPGAYPGLGAEERGQAEAIAFNLREMAKLRVPVLVTITGEGGSGGALALGVGNRVNMLEFSTYSVISPEGCASILWRDPLRSRDAAEAMKITAPDLKSLDIVDDIVKEANGGAHANPVRQAVLLGDVLERQLQEFDGQSAEQLIQGRYDRFRKLGVFEVA